MKSYPDLTAGITDAMRLAESMTYKWAVTGFPRGGGKTVIALSHALDADERRALLRRYGRLIHQLGGLFVTGPDVGTSPADMDVIAETGDPFIFGRSEEAGGSGDSGRPTALGVFEGIRTACMHAFGSPDLTGRRVVVQGVGSVGMALARYLVGDGADVIISDLNAEALQTARGELGVDAVHPDAVYDTACDVFSPCALGGVLNAETIPRLRCRIVAGAANAQLDTAEDAERLRERGIVYAPDFVINMGGAIALLTMESLGWSRAETDERLVEAITSSLREVFASATAEGISTTAAARRLADERLRAE
jgi:leucine dehydrogenase